MDRFKILNAWHIKLLMAALMLLDHLPKIHNLVPPGAAFVFTAVSRCVAPMFAYLAVEGIRHTRNLRNYCLRLLTLALIVFAGNGILNAVFKEFSASLSENDQSLLLINNNVIFTLALGVFCIAFIVWGKEKPAKIKIGLFAAAGICFITGFFIGEWGSVIIPFMAVTYFLRDKKIARYIGYAVIEIIAVLLPFSEPLWFIVFPFIFLYNGKRGNNARFSKYFFYVFYPLHLWCIAAINFYVMIR